MMLRSAPLGLLLLAVAGLAGCATVIPASTSSEIPETPRRTFASRERDVAAEAYYHYSVAQMLVQGGRFKDAVAPMQEAIKRDPDSAYLWGQLAQWLVRADQP